MNDYKKLCEELRECYVCKRYDFGWTMSGDEIADAIEQLVKERDAAIAKSNKAIVPPCGIGDTIYVIYDKKIYAAKMVLDRGRHGSVLEAV